MRVTAYLSCLTVAYLVKVGRVCSAPLSSKAAQWRVGVHVLQLLRNPFKTARPRAAAKHRHDWLTSDQSQVSNLFQRFGGRVQGGVGNKV